MLKTLQTCPLQVQLQLKLNQLKPPVLRGMDTPFTHMYDMIRVHCGNLTSVNNLWSPHTLYGTGIILSPTCMYSPPHV